MSQIRHPNATCKSRRDRREDAEKRAVVPKLSPAEQLNVLNTRLGKNKGAKKERKRLEALLS